MECLINEMSANNSKFGEVIAKLVLAELKSFHKDMKEEMVELRNCFKNLSMRSCSFHKDLSSADTLEDNAYNGLNGDQIIECFPNQEDKDKDDEEGTVSPICINDDITDVLVDVDVPQLWPNADEEHITKNILENVANSIKPVDTNPVKKEVDEDAMVSLATSMFSSQFESINSITASTEVEDAQEDNHGRDDINHSNALDKDCEFNIVSVEDSGNLQYFQKSNVDAVISVIETTIPQTSKRYICRICSKVFRYPGTLRQHFRIHTGERPYSCTHCGKRFAKKGVAKIHMLTHSEERPYVCNVCGKSFKLKHNLKKHVLIHTGVKPHKCELCKKSFTSFRTLWDHYIKHNRLQPICK